MPPAIRELLPPVYTRLLPDLLHRVAPEETRATCDDCAMCSGGESANVTFLPSTKCCTFQPQLPNYLVGALLADPDPALAEGQRRLRAHIASRARVTPRWVAPPRRLWAIYQAARYAAFGRSETILCPYYDDGRCSIWRYRESYCSTFFCKHDAGEDGRQFWRQLRRYLDQVEHALTQHLTSQVAPELVEPKRLMTLEELEDQPPHPDDYAEWWGDWQGREEELYQSCAQELAQMDRATFDGLLARANKVRLPLLGEALDVATSPELPAELVFPTDGVRLTPLGDAERVKVSAYSEYDPIVLPAAMVAALSQITEPRSVAQIRERTGADDALLARLKRWRILVPPEGTKDI